MALPALTLAFDPGATDGFSLHFAETQGVPDPGNNLLELPFIDAGLQLRTVVVEEMLVYVTTYFESNLVIDSSVQGVAAAKIFVDPFSGLPTALSPDRRQLALFFDQQGADQVRVTVQLAKTEIR